MKRILLIAGAILISVGVAGFVWLNYFRSDGPDEFDLSESPGNGSQSSEPSEALSNLDGSWVVASGSEAGYRVLEDLRGVKDFEVIGRTSTLDGEVTIEGTSVVAATFEIPVDTISTDSSQRDNAFKGPNVMNVQEFPTATFELTGPADFGSIPAPGESVTSQITGDLTLRGVTQPVTLDVQGQIVGGQIELVGSIDVVFSDYGIANPSNAVATVRDSGTVEVKLLLARQ